VRSIGAFSNAISRDAMSIIEEASRSIRGAWRIARFDPDAMQDFDLSIDGFWRSFLAALIVIPPSLLVSVFTEVGPRADHISEDMVGYLVQQTLLRGGLWLLFPLAMVPVARLLNLSSTYVQYIIVWNWSQVIVAAVMLSATILLGSDLLGQEIGGLILMLAFLSVSFYAYLVARVALGCEMPMAIGVVVLDFVLTLTVSLAADRMLYPASVAAAGG